MAPKRTPKSEENSRKETSNKEAVNKKIKNVTEVSSRTLRPRTQAAVESLKTETKVKSVKEKLKAGKKRSSKQPNGGEPEEKQSKLDAIEEDDIDLVNATSIYEFTANDINGQSVSLKKYKGHVCVIVNVASRCGHTSSNYKEFVDIYDKFSVDRGLRILAFPCNQFGKQEPGDNEKICEFAKNHNVKFDMFAKIEVNGKKAHPLWKYLTNQKQGPKGKNIDWNFTKFLVNKDGQVVERYKPSVKPSALVNKLEKLW